METEAAPKKRRLTAFGKKARRERIFARLREGWAYDEIARQEGLTAARVRQIVAEVLHRREIDDNTAHALLQLARLGPAVQLVGEAVARGVLVAPQLAVDAPDSSAGKFWSPGGFAAFLNEAGGKLGEFYPGRRAGGLAAVALDRPLWPVQELVRDLAAATTSRPNSADTGSPRRSLKLPVRFFPERSLTKRVGQSCRRSA